jgi:hypothetical protein
MSRTNRSVPIGYDTEEYKKYRRDGGFSSGICWGFKSGRLYQSCYCGCEQGDSSKKRFATKVRRAFEKRDTRIQLGAAQTVVSNVTFASVV